MNKDKVWKKIIEVKYFILKKQKNSKNLNTWFSKKFNILNYCILRIINLISVFFWINEIKHQILWKNIHKFKYCILKQKKINGFKCNL